MAFFMQNKHTAIGHISRVHGYKGKIVISLINPDLITLNEDHTVWINTDGIESPFKIQNIQILNKSKRILTLQNLTGEKAEKLKNKKVFIDLKDHEYDKSNISQKSIIDYTLYNQNDNLIGKISAVIEIQNNNLIQIFINNEEVLIPYNEINIIELNHSLNKVKLNIAEGLIELYTDAQ